jgi:hypothetical protein
MSDLETIQKEAHAQCDLECAVAIVNYDALKLAAETHRDEAIAKIPTNLTQEEIASSTKDCIATFLFILNRVLHEREHFCAIHTKIRNKTILQAELRVINADSRASVEKYFNQNAKDIDSELATKLLDGIFAPRK